MLKIGIDLDGVVIDSEKTFRVYEEIFDMEIGGKGIVDITEPKYQGRYDWTEEQQQEFINKYYLQVSKESNLMSGFASVFKLLKELDMEFVVITARGVHLPEMKDDAIRLLNENNIEFDEYYWNISDKLEICQKENIDVMIDDDHKIAKQLSDNGIKTLYFRDTNLKKLEENENLKEVNNWGDVLRYIKTLILEKQLNTSDTKAK